MMGNGSIPVLCTGAESLAGAWENSVWMAYTQGCDIRTEYDARDDKGNWLHPPSKDCTMLVTVMDPSSEPAIHRAFPGGLEDLEEYRQEVVDGIKDHWVRNPNNPEDKRWEYTYHARLTAYDVSDVEHQAEVPNEAGGRTLHLSLPTVKINQLDKMVKKLAQAPYSRRCNAVTWQPWCDPDCYDPPCLQSIWCRVLEDEKGVWRLNMNVRFRSRDAYDAAFMNMWALIGLQERLAIRLSREADREVKLGHYCDLSDSYHVYGRRHQHFEENFLKLLTTRTFEERTWTREFAEPVFAEARPKIKAKIAAQDAKYK